MGPDHQGDLADTQAADAVSRTRTRAAFGTALFFLSTPGAVAGIVPWWLTGWRSGAGYWLPVRIVGAFLVCAGIPVLVRAFVRFVVEGAGTPAPVAPTEHLVVGGLYRYVRNPMYLAVVSIIVGQALLLCRPVLLVHATVVALAVGGFVHWYEEPTLARTFGAEYDDYRRAVPGWWPRLRTWSRPAETSGTQ